MERGFGGMGAGAVGRKVTEVGGFRIRVFVVTSFLNDP